MRIKHFLHSLGLLGLAACLGGCAGVAYYGQAIGGHLDVLQRRQPVASLLADPDTPARLRERLQQAVTIREFAIRCLGLPANDSYLSYADLERPYAVWNVIATPELSLTPRQWCFPFAGCLQYRGYYARTDARAYARRLAAEGYDTHVAGASAYSTLGWFADPLLNTMLYRNDSRLAEIIFHELAHQRIFIQDDTEFNEAFAQAVAIAGTRRWLQRHGNEAERDAYQRRLQIHDDILEMILETRRSLAEVYAAETGKAEKRRQKQARLERLQQRYRRRRLSEWRDFDAYDSWFSGELNNARLAAVATYWDLVPAFLDRLEALDSDLERFYRQIARLESCDHAERRHWLAGGDACQ